GERDHWQRAGAGQGNRPRGPTCHDPSENPSRDPARPMVMSASRSLGLQLQLLGTRGPEGFDGSFEAMARARPEALFALLDSKFFGHRNRIADLALRHRLSSMYGNREAVEAGGLMSYGPDFASQFRRAAVYVDKILKGAKPADLPVERMAIGYFAPAT